MKIPLMTYSFCGCSLETGTKIIAWLHLVLQAIAFVIILVVVILGSVVIGSVNSAFKNDETREMENMFNRFPSSDGNSQAKETGALIGGIVAAGVLFMIIVFGLLLMYFIATVFLLIGAQKKRPGYLVYWLVITCIGMIGFIAAEWNLENFIIFAINFYFTWVVYSYYRQLCDDPESSVPPAGNRELKLIGDGPHVVTPNAPPAYSCNQKGFPM